MTVKLNQVKETADTAMSGITSKSDCLPERSLERIQNIFIAADANFHSTLRDAETFEKQQANFSLTKK